MDMTSHQTPVVTIDEVLPLRRGSGSGPHIAVVVSLNFPDLIDSVADLVRQYGRSALQYLEDNDARWTLFDTSGALPDSVDMTQFDGLLVLGGGDVDSEIYGVAGPVPHEYGVDPAADHFSLDLIRNAIDGGVPTLGICRGSQLMNVAYGGTLIPDIAETGTHHGEHDGELMIDETVSIDPQSRLAKILETSTVVGKTGHHQAVATVAPVFRVSATAHDGVVEGIEHTSAWAIGVQWHPEDTTARQDSATPLFAAFVAQCAHRETWA
jgi:putative glutamine amidotransferase